MSIKPRGKVSNYVGVEIEFVSKYPMDMVREFVVAMGMDTFCEVVRDSSIEDEDADFNLTATGEYQGYRDYTEYMNDHGLELRIISREVDLWGKLQAVKDLLDVVCAQINSSCGLHVHLDMRNRSPQTSLKRLLENEDTLIAMIPYDRVYGDYCRPTQHYVDALGLEGIPHFIVQRGHVEARAYSKYSGINILSYNRLKTIEVRYHEGTRDIEEIYNWCKLLTNIVEGEALDGRYIEKRINECA